jgi:flagellar motor switch protein FliN/FliY
MSQKSKPETPARIIAHLQTALANALSSMTGKTFTVTEQGGSETDELEQPIVWQQAFSSSAEPALWLAAGKDLWSAAGQLTLGAVGIDSVTDEDCRSTWQEILGQTMGGLATALTSDLHKEITASKGEESASSPPELEWRVFTARYDETVVGILKAAWSHRLTALYEDTEPLQKAIAPRDSTFSKTFDLLLDVALPVNVSFGKTSLQIREVLKLNTGSIVELNRFVVEPVEVIVNNCVIARGEVVVVDGNYGVRITQLASREDRLKFGMAETSSRTAVPR